jgi:hypothetical protein
LQTEQLGVLKVTKLVVFLYLNIPYFPLAPPTALFAMILSLILLLIFLLIQGYKLFPHRNFRGNSIDYIDKNTWKAYRWTEKL